MNKRNVLSVILTFVFAVVTAGVKPNSAYRAYIQKYKDIAIEQMLRYKIPASITLAQGLLESGAGQSRLTRESNNHFGIKCHGWKGRKVYHDDDSRGECFRAYPNAYFSFKDHSEFLVKSPRYERLFKLKRTDYKGWARGLKACGYATNPKYAQLLINVIETYNLDRYDYARKYDKNLIKKMIKDSNEPDADTGFSHRIYKNNKCYYIIAREGDTFKSLGRELGESYRKLAKYNERDKRDILEEGDIIYLQKKRTKADKKYKGFTHYVSAGESMYSISQLYGIRLKNLYKINKLDPKTYVMKTGDRLKVR